MKTRIQGERWYLDTGDASNSVQLAVRLANVFVRVQKYLGIHGEAKPTHGLRATTLATDLCKVNPYLAQQVLGHQDISTTISGYAAPVDNVVLDALDEREKHAQLQDAALCKMVRLIEQI